MEIEINFTRTNFIQHLTKDHLTFEFDPLFLRCTMSRIIGERTDYSIINNFKNFPSRTYVGLTFPFGTERRGDPPIRNTRRACVLAAHIRNGLLSTWGRVRRGTVRNGVVSKYAGAATPIAIHTTVARRLMASASKSTTLHLSGTHSPLPPRRCNGFFTRCKTCAACLYRFVEEDVKK